MTTPATALLSLRPVRDDQGPWLLHDAAATRSLEAVAGAAWPPHTLMERAGGAVARLALAMAPHAQRFCVLAGPGNNGGDGVVAARALHRAGRTVRVHLLADPARLPTDARWALQGAAAAGVPIDHGPLQTDGADLVIDALLGLGSRRPVEGALADAIQRINASRLPVLAVDLPSGLDGDSGQVIGGLAIQASATLALLTLKAGLFTGSGRDLAGTVWFDDLAAGNEAATASAGARLIGLSQVRRAFSARPHASHKGSFGDLAVVGGAPGMLGAVWLAAAAALTAGAGRVFVCPLDANAPPLQAARPELMLRPGWWRSAPGVLAGSTVVCGCGGGAAVREALPALLSQAGRLVLDADALNAIAADSGLQALLDTRAARGRATVLTPHPLEAARLLACTASEVQQQRLEAARTLADRHRCVVVLKGAGSIVAEPAALPSINPTGNALLATAGTGDVLAGWIGGLWASHSGLLTVADAARAAVWLHGRAADAALARSGPALPLRAADLIDEMRRAVPR